jgi:hypothetical protein
MSPLTESTRLVLAKGQPFPNDPYLYTNTSLLLYGNGTNGSTVITDSSGSPKTVTAVGNAQISTAQSKFGGASIAFDGNGDYATTPHLSALDLSSGDFTVEAWIYHVARPLSNFQHIINKDGVNGVSFAAYAIYISSTGELTGSIGNGAGVSPTETTYTFGVVPLATWTHIALVKSGTTIRTFLNGTAVTTQTQGTAMINGSKNLLIGFFQGSSAAAYFNGYIDDLRITKGVARYTSNFTPPTLQLPGFSPIP